MKYTIEAFVDFRESAPTEHLGIAVHRALPRSLGAKGWVVVAIGDNFARMEVCNQLLNENPLLEFPVIAHPSASIAPSAELGPGTVVLQGAVIGARTTTGRGCLVNSGAVVDHETELSDYCSVGPGATLGGRVRIGERSVISIGATVKHGISVGRDAVLGAAAYAHQDIPSLCVAYGVPAREVRPRAASDTYLG